MLGLGIIDGEYELINALGPSQENCVMRDCDICYLFQQYIILDSVKKFQFQVTHICYIGYLNAGQRWMR